MILDRFARLIPGDTYRKKLYFWNLIQYIFYWVCFIVFSPFQANPIMWWVYITTTEFFTNDGHIYGDFGYIFTGKEIRGIIWVFTILAMIVLSYLWAYRNNKVAKFLRTGSYIVTLTSYIIWTLFFTWGFPSGPRYDYAGWASRIVAYRYNPLVVLMAMISLSAMWFGVIISNGYLIYKGWREEQLVATKRSVYSPKTMIDRPVSSSARVLLVVSGLIDTAGPCLNAMITVVSLVASIFFAVRILLPALLTPQLRLPSVRRSSIKTVAHETVQPTTSKTDGSIFSLA